MKLRGLCTNSLSASEELQEMCLKSVAVGVTVSGDRLKHQEVSGSVKMPLTPN